VSITYTGSARLPDPHVWGGAPIPDERHLPISQH